VGFAQRQVVLVETKRLLGEAKIVRGERGREEEEERRFGERREECKRSSDRRFRGEGSCSVNNMLRL
jgi:hypothetical protein